MRSHRLVAAIVSIIALTGVGCAHSPRVKPSTEDISAKFQRIDSRNIGVVYSWSSSDGYTPLLDLVSSRVLNERMGGLKTSKLGPMDPIKIGQISEGEQTGICDPKSKLSQYIPKSLCDGPSVVDILVFPSDVTQHELLDPFALLELVNRPVSGLIYNRDAEARVMQWRTALAGGGYGNRRIFLCSRLEIMTAGTIVIRGRLNLEKAARIAGLVNSSRLFDIDYGAVAILPMSEGTEFRFPFRSDALIRAVLKELSVVQTSTFPRVDFTLGEARDIRFVR